MAGGCLEKVDRVAFLGGVRHLGKKIQKYSFLIFLHKKVFEEIVSAPKHYSE